MPSAGSVVQSAFVAHSPQVDTLMMPGTSSRVPQLAFAGSEQTSLLSQPAPGEEEEVSAEDEELVEKCLEIIRQEKRASTSLLQRRLRLGYTRAARIVDILEQRGILGPGEGAKPREILVDLDAAV